MRRLSFVLCLLPGVLSLPSCGGDSEDQTARELAPRPVSVITLRESNPNQSMAVTGTVGSWKTKDIGFEVSGRVQYVIEPETNVSGPGSHANPIPLARIEPERYETAVESANAKILMLEKQKSAAIIERDQVLPAQKASAVRRNYWLRKTTTERRICLIRKRSPKRSSTSSMRI